MIKISNLISEKFEIPPDLQKQLENTVYSALGYILYPQIDKLKKKLFDSNEINNKSYVSLKNVISTIRMMTESGGGNTKFTFTDVFVSGYFSITTAKEITKKIKITVEKSGNEIYVESDEKKEKNFPNFVISKDYAGWDLKRINDFWKQLDDDYNKSKKEFDNKIILIEQLKRKLDNWKILDKPKKPKIHPDNQRMVWVYEKETPDGQKYDHYFRTVLNKKEDSYELPNHFQSSSNPPYIVQTIYLDKIDINNVSSITWFLQQTNNTIITAKHEGRHLLQHYNSINNKLSGDIYGGPKKNLTHGFNTDVRGINPDGSIITPKTWKDVGDIEKKVLHPHRDVEFKTNLYDYKDEIETVLNQHIPKKKWKEAFRNLLLYTIGKLNYSEFTKTFRYDISWSHTTTYKHLKELYINDRPKFNQMVKELYKLIFNQ